MKNMLTDMAESACENDIPVGVAYVSIQEWSSGHI